MSKTLTWLLFIDVINETIKINIDNNILNAPSTMLNIYSNDDETIVHEVMISSKQNISINVDAQTLKNLKNIYVGYSTIFTDTVKTKKNSSNDLKEFYINFKSNIKKILPELDKNFPPEIQQRLLCQIINSSTEIEQISTNDIEERLFSDMKYFLIYHKFITYEAEEINLNKIYDEIFQLKLNKYLPMISKKDYLVI
jgi:hypothetical protein